MKRKGQQDSSKRNITNNPFERYICVFCHWEFTSSESLISHMHSHFSTPHQPRAFIPLSWSLSYPPSTSSSSRTGHVSLQSNVGNIDGERWGIDTYKNLDGCKVKKQEITDQQLGLGLDYSEKSSKLSLGGQKSIDTQHASSSKAPRKRSSSRHVASSSVAVDTKSTSGGASSFAVANHASKSYQRGLDMDLNEMVQLSPTQGKEGESIVRGLDININTEDEKHARELLRNGRGKRAREPSDNEGGRKARQLSSGMRFDLNVDKPDEGGEGAWEPFMSGLDVVQNEPVFNGGGEGGLAVGMRFDFNMPYEGGEGAWKPFMSGPNVVRNEPILNRGGEGGLVVDLNGPVFDGGGEGGLDIDLNEPVFDEGGEIGLGVELNEHVLNGGGEGGLAIDLNEPVLDEGGEGGFDLDNEPPGGGGLDFDLNDEPPGGGGLDFDLNDEPPGEGGLDFDLNDEPPGDKRLGFDLNGRADEEDSEGSTQP